MITTLRHQGRFEILKIANYHIFFFFFDKYQAKCKFGFLIFDNVNVAKTLRDILGSSNRLMCGMISGFAAFSSYYKEEVFLEVVSLPLGRAVEVRLPTSYILVPRLLVGLGTVVDQKIYTNKCRLSSNKTAIYV